MSLLFGFHMPNFTFADAKGAALFDRIVEQAKAAETAGFDLVTVMDHFYQIGGIGPEADPMLEAYTTLAAIARAGEVIKLMRRSEERRVGKEGRSRWSAYH